METVDVDEHMSSLTKTSSVAADADVKTVHQIERPVNR
jgi:hypothetical protein